MSDLKESGISFMSKFRTIVIYDYHDLFSQFPVQNLIMNY